MRKKIIWAVIGLSLGLLFMGVLRLSSAQPNLLTPLAGFATPGYILVTVLFTVLLVRRGLPLNPSSPQNIAKQAKSGQNRVQVQYISCDFPCSDL